MRSQPSTAAQRALVAALGYELRYAPQEYGPTGTYDEASAVSEWLLKIRRERWSSTPMHAAMRKADFAALRASGKDQRKPLCRSAELFDRPLPAMARRQAA